jgi:hypothetical protein
MEADYNTVGDSQDEVLYDKIDATVERATRLIPHIQTKIIPNSGHLSNDRPNLVSTKVMKFLAE